MTQPNCSHPISPIVIIPARMASTRLPNKPLVDINGVPMILHVLARALAADVGPVVVAAGDAVIADAVASAGGRVVITDPNHQSGSDRIFEALEYVDPKEQHDVVVNLQGDLPTIKPNLIQEVTELQGYEGIDIGTLATIILSDIDRKDPNVVKAIIEISLHKDRGRALNFTRNEGLKGPGPFYQHIGIYAFRRAALAKFVALPRSFLEKSEGLEQLRALEAGMRIEVGLTDSAPTGVDTPADLKIVRSLLA